MNVLYSDETLFDFYKKNKHGWIDYEELRANTLNTSDYNNRNVYLLERYTEVLSTEFYQDLFMETDIATYLSLSDKKKGKTLPEEQNKKPCPIVSYQIDNAMIDEKITYERNGKIYKHGSHRQKIMFNDYKALEYTNNNRFALCGACTYSGKRRDSSKAYACHGFIIDLDGVKEDNLRKYCFAFENGVLPKPTYIVNSGHGLHVYFIFERPVPLYKTSISALSDIKRVLTNAVWTSETSIWKNRQYQGIYQAFRMVGSWTTLATDRKNKTKYIQRAFKVGEKIKLYDLCVEFFPQKEHWLKTSTWEWLNNRDYSDSVEGQGRLPLEEAKKLYPKWYKRRIIDKAEPRTYMQNEGLYYWWLDIIEHIGIQDGIFDGNRYHCCCVAFAFAKKCGIEKEKAYEDLIQLLPHFDSVTKQSNNHFTEKDIKDASSFYDSEKSITMSNQGIRNITSVVLDQYIKTRRNGRTQAEHLERCRVLRALSSYDNVGRPTKEQQVKEYFEQNPNASINQAARDLGVSKPTIRKWKS